MSKTGREAEGDGRIVGIELIRFACAAAVLVFHYPQLASIGGTLPANISLEAMPLYRPLRLFYDAGFYGVQIFWCISGFIFFWKYGSTIARQRIDGRKFFVLRLSRLYPLHLLTLLFVAGMQLIYSARTGLYYVYQQNDLYHFILQLFLASNWGLQVGDSFNGPIWSISVEVLVYGIFFLTLRYICGSTAFLACMAIAGTLVQILKISTHPLFVCIMFFYLGCLTAVAYTRCTQNASYKRVATILSAAALVFMPLATAHFAIRPKYLLVVVTPALIYLCVTYIRVTPLTSRFLVPAGNMTYSSYLLHVPLQIVIVTYCAYTGTALPIYSPLLFLGYLAVTLLLSAWSYQHLEMPAQSWMRRRFMRRTPVIVQSPT
jgi:peptidoglycan/LPS O-acetylase OafA/YrhL